MLGKITTKTGFHWRTRDDLTTKQKMLNHKQQQKQPFAGLFQPKHTISTTGKPEIIEFKSDFTLYKLIWSDCKCQKDA